MNISSRYKWFLPLLLLTLAPACGSGDGGNGGFTSGPANGSGGGGFSPEQAADELCMRFDECNALEGVSVNECVQYTDDCVDESFNQSQAQDWALQIDDCLQLSSCDFFYECWLDVPRC